jgi:hypothetical protein
VEETRIRLLTPNVQRTTGRLLVYWMYSERTFASDRNITMMWPVAIGMLVVPVEDGMKWPIATPIAIARRSRA